MRSITPVPGGIKCDVPWSTASCDCGTSAIAGPTRLEQLYGVLEPQEVGVPTTISVGGSIPRTSSSGHANSVV